MTFWPENIYCGESQPHRPIWVGIFKRPETPTSSWKVMGLSVSGHVQIHEDGQTRTILPVLQVASRPVRESYGYKRKALCPSYRALGNQGATYTPHFKHLLNTKGWGQGDERVHLHGFGTGAGLLLTRSQCEQRPRQSVCLSPSL